MARVEHETSKSKMERVEHETSKKYKKISYCQKCRYHGFTSPVPGHKQHCKYKNCTCEKCNFSNLRKKICGMRKLAAQELPVGINLAEFLKEVKSPTSDGDPSKNFIEKMIRQRPKNCMSILISTCFNGNPKNAINYFDYVAGNTIRLKQPDIPSFSNLSSTSHPPNITVPAFTLPPPPQSTPSSSFQFQQTTQIPSFSSLPDHPPNITVPAFTLAPSQSTLTSSFQIQQTTQIPSFSSLPDPPLLNFSFGNSSAYHDSFHYY